MNEGTIETRDYCGGQFSIGNRSADAPLGTLTGYAAAFNSPSHDLGGFKEVLMPGCFSETLRRDDQVALVQHCDWLLLGRKSTGQLSLSEDHTGLKFTIRPPDTSAARDAVEYVRTGVLRKCSFAFRCGQGDDSFEPPSRDNPLYTRVVNRVRLFEISVVSSPAYESTSVKVRAAAAARLVQPSGRALRDAAMEQRLSEYFALRDKARRSWLDRDWDRAQAMASELHGRWNVPYLVLAQS